jgi:uncharacterized protein with HEPN domain
MIHEIEKVLHGISHQELAGDLYKRMALERMLEIVSVASEHIPVNVKAAEGKVGWQAIAAIGQRLENTRDRIEADVLWTNRTRRCMRRPPPSRIRKSPVAVILR